MKIILIRFSSLGDCVLLCPLAAHLKAHGAEEVTVITKGAYTEVFSSATGVDRVVEFDPATGLRGLSRIAAGFRDRSHRVLDAHNNWRSRVLSLRLGGAAGRFEKDYAARLGLIVFKRPAALPTILERYGALAASVGLPTGHLSPGGIDIPSRWIQEADRCLVDDGRPYVALAPGARWPDKRWPLDHYTELAGRLVRKHGYRLVLLGDKNDRAAATAIQREVGDWCVDIAGRAGLMEGAAYLQRCAGFVGNDSGLAHLAEAVGLRVVALYGPTVEAFGYYPSLPGSKPVERNLPCRPCSRNGARPCPKRTGECLAAIEVADIERATLDMLSGAGPERYSLA